MLDNTPSIGRRLSPRLILLLTAVLLGGCAMSDDKAASLLVTRGNYELYSCPQLAVAAGPLRQREHELKGLMARADVDASGRMMSAIGYRPEYLKIRGELNDLEATQREKHCDPSEAAAPAAAASAPAR